MNSQAEKLPDTHQDDYSKTVFGFWVYLMTDFILFGVLFAVYVVLHNKIFGGTPARELFNLPYTLTQTLVLLLTSLTVGLGGAFAHRRKKGMTILLFLLTFLLGAIFLGMMLTEFSRFIASGNSWDKSAFLSAFFTLVGTHGVHVIFGLLWILVFLFPVWRQGLTPLYVKRLTCLRMFWQFLNVVWIFIFSIVYLMGGNLA